MPGARQGRVIMIIVAIVVIAGMLVGMAAAGAATVPTN
jgi:hypothetical protein